MPPNPLSAFPPIPSPKLDSWPGELNPSLSVSSNGRWVIYCFSLFFSVNYICCIVMHSVYWWFRLSSWMCCVFIFIFLLFSPLLELDIIVVVFSVCNKCHFWDINSSLCWFFVVEYMSLPASQYSVLDAERIERVDENTFRCYVYRFKFFAFEVCPVLLVRVGEQPNGCCIKLLSCKVWTLFWAYSVLLWELCAYLLVSGHWLDLQV